MAQIRHRTNRGTKNRYEGKLDYDLPAPWVVIPFEAYSGQFDLFATLGPSTTSIPLAILNNGSPGTGPNDDDDGNPYDVLFWELDDSTSLGFAQDTYVFREGAPGVNVLQNIPLVPNSSIKSLVILIEDYQSTPIRRGNSSVTPIVETEASDFVVYSSSGDEVVNGLEGDDQLFVGPGNDVVNGGSGDDRLVGNTGDDRLFGEAGGDALHGLDGKDKLYGGSGDDGVFGGPNDDVAYGGPGDDDLNGDAGVDVLVGGEGNDTYLITNDTSDTITEFADQGIDTVDSFFSITTLPNHVEWLILRGENAVTGIGNDLDNVIQEQPSRSDSGVAPPLPPVNNTIQAKDGNDIVNAGDGDDTIDGGAGDDTLVGWLKTDTVTGGSGADRFIFTTNGGNYSISRDGIDLITDFNLAEGDKLVIAQGNFVSRGDPSAVLPLGLLAADRFHLGTAATTPAHRFIYDSGTGALFYDADGSDGFDAQFQIATLPVGLPLNSTAIEVIGGFTISPVSSSIPTPIAGNMFNGTAGPERIDGSPGNDSIMALSGDDIVNGLEGNDRIQAGNGKDFLDGGSGDDLIAGEQGSDRVYGEAGNDTLNGGDQNDTINGGTGNDTLTGGAGNDRFNFYNPALEGIDQITDFNISEDTIGLYIGDRADSDYRNAGFAVNTVLRTDQFCIGVAAQTASERLIYNPNTGGLFFDVDGTGAAASIPIATLSPGLALSAANFLAFDDTNVNAPESPTPPDQNNNQNNQNNNQNNQNNQNGNNINNNNHQIIGTAGNDRLKGTAADDVILGLGGNDRLSGEAGNDTLNGGRGNDRLRGGNGRDRLASGAGNDRVIGGRGRDIFLLEKGKGRDLILDFQDKQDRLGLAPDLRFNQLSLIAQGRNTRISLGQDELAVLVGVRPNQISAADFLLQSSRQVL